MSKEPHRPKQKDRRRNRVIANRAFGAIKAQHAAERTLLETVADTLNHVASSPVRQPAGRYRDSTSRRNEMIRAAEKG